jgi:hypothetical protein
VAVKARVPGVWVNEWIAGSGASNPGQQPLARPLTLTAQPSGTQLSFVPSKRRAINLRQYWPAGHVHSGTGIAVAGVGAGEALGTSILAPLHASTTSSEDLP